MRSWGVVLAVGIGLSAGSALATDPSCLRDARTTFGGCVAQCRDDFKTTKFSCRGVDPACGKACLAGRQACIDTIEDVLTTGKLPSGGTLTGCDGGTAACRTTLDQAKQTCGAPCNGDATCDVCVDAAQVAAFVCRDTCREAFRADSEVKAALDACRSTFKSCIAACPQS